MERRKVHRLRIGRELPERRKQVFDRRRHTSILRILFIPWRRLFSEFSSVKFFT